MIITIRVTALSKNIEKYLSLSVEEAVDSRQKTLTLSSEKLSITCFTKSPLLYRT